MVGRIIIYFFLLVSVTLYSQHIPGIERSDPAERAKGQLEANRVRTTVFNHCQTGRYSGDYPVNIETPYEWPKNSGQVYLALTGLFIGGEVTDSTGTVKHIIDVMNYRTSPEGKSWNLEPVPGYFNKNNSSDFKIANSNDPETWPEFWPDRLKDETDPGWDGSWDGLLGKNKFLEGQEIYFKATDDKYDKFPYYFPDSTDYSRKGLGLLIKGRAFSLTETHLEDVVFQQFEIINDGTSDLDKLSLSMWVADFIGGSGDSNDDILSYDVDNNIVLFTDKDRKSPTFNGGSVGAVGIVFLKTPNKVNTNNEIGLSSVNYIPAGGLDIDNDEKIWDDILAPGNFVDPGEIVPGEYDAFLSNGYFSLKPGESQDFTVAIIFANGDSKEKQIDAIYNKLKAVRDSYNAGFIFDSFTASLKSPKANEVFQEKVDVVWSTGSEKTTNYIYLSEDYGNSWTLLAIDSTGSDSLSFPVEEFQEGILNKIKVISISENGTSRVESDDFSIDNPASESKPQMYITYPKSGDTLSGEVNINWIAGTAEGKKEKINLYYSTDNGNEYLISENLTGANYNFNSLELPNTSNLNIIGKIVTNDGTYSFKTGMLSVQNERDIFQLDDIIVSKNSPATGKLKVDVVDRNVAKKNEYKIVFKRESFDSLLYYDIYDSDGIKLIDSAFVPDATTEGPLFDGMRVKVDDDPLLLNEDISGWNVEGISDYNFDLFIVPDRKGTKRAADYEVIFGDVGFGNSKDIIVNKMIFPAKDVNFRVKNITENKFIDFAFIELDSTTGAGKLSANGVLKDRIVFLEDIKGDLKDSWWVYLNDTTGTEKRFPKNGDILTIKQFKPFGDGDEIIFSTEKIVSVEKDEKGIASYYLGQNYPNPFNPSTSISYDVPKSGRVQIKVYDILGKEIATLVDEVKPAGNYTISFNAPQFASGVYFYRMQGENYFSVKKMMLIK